MGTFAVDMEAFGARRANSAATVDTAPAYSVAAVRDVSLKLAMDHEDFLCLEVLTSSLTSLTMPTSS